ncbi:MAG: hypothetical protein ACYDA4_04955 [Ignavibacteriaceae bacterium]
MRYVFSLIVSLIIFNGCEHTGDTFSLYPPDKQPTLSVSSIKDSILYTFAVPKTTFGIYDTLSAKLIAYNESTVPDTLYSSYSPYFYTWSLKNNTGRTIMFGPMGANNSIRLIPINSQRSEILYNIYQVIKDISGAPLTAGSYMLQWNLNDHGNTYLSFPLTIKIQ